LATKAEGTAHMVRTKADVIQACIKYGKVLETVFSGFELRLYGSYHEGNPTVHSHIDVAVVCNEFKDIEYTLSLQILNRLKVDVDTYIAPISLDYDEFHHPLPGSIAAQVAKTNELVFKSQY
jgi:predicted nucleotidyltransferase